MLGTVSSEEVVDGARLLCEEVRLGITKPLVMMHPLSSTIVEARRLSLRDEGRDFASQKICSVGGISPTASMLLSWIMLLVAGSANLSEDMFW